MMAIGRVVAGARRAMMAGILVVAGSAAGSPAPAGTAQHAERGAAVPRGVRVVRDVAYGSGRRQRFDVYAPEGARGAPVVFMVHGGGWRRGDKALRAVVENKVNRWAGAGLVVISVNYRMLPDADPVEQARDVARALAAAQRRAADWGGAPDRFILMGHSAGAHLVALLATSPAVTRGADPAPWLGMVLLDGAALNVVEMMEARHARLFDRAFGRDPRYWRAASPFHALHRALPPTLAVCSGERPASCPQARDFLARAASLGTRTAFLEEPLSHREINERLGAPGGYTERVETFMRGLGIGDWGLGIGD